MKVTKVAVSLLTDKLDDKPELTALLAAGVVIVSKRERLNKAAPSLLKALKETLAHVEDVDVEQCTLCHSYRMIGHAAIAKAEGK